MRAAPIVPIEKNVVLLGAGNAHLVFVRKFGMRPIPGVAVTLVSEASVIPYSAMVPGHVAGNYSLADITIDLVRLCRAMNVRFLADRASAIDPIRRTVAFASRPELCYDVLSLGVGSLSVRPVGVAGHPYSWLLRPLDQLIARLDDLEERLRASPRHFRLAIVGGGVSGCELALAIARRFAGIASLHLTLLHAGPRLLPQFPEAAADIFNQLLHERGVALRLDARVTDGDLTTLELNGSERFPYDGVLWATNAAPAPLLADCGLPLGDDGFLRVHDTLQAVSRHPSSVSRDEGNGAVFGTGDCIRIEEYPHLLKNGVYAVREGAVLFENVRRFLHERPLMHFRPQRYCLCLMNTADGQAVLSYGDLVWKSRLARRLKDRIDRAWIDKFTRFPVVQPTPEESGEAYAMPQMRCGGCGSKISSDVLSAVLKRIDAGDDPRILMGTRAGEDASVHRMRPELFGPDPQKLVEVQTVDYFKAFVDDPYLFGRIAALNSVSDIFAMNARPFAALAIATLPYARGPVQETMLYELLSGAVHSLRELGVVLTGGHTTEGSELALGFAVTGYGEEGTLFEKGRLAVGDVLILTKPLGSGALLAAWMRGACRARWYDALVASMLRANGQAADIFRRQGVRACTDVTGFGLAGHLLEMLDASRLPAHVHSDQVPIYDGFNEVVKNGIVSTLQRDNAKAACRVQGTAPAWLFDPQTSGGLIAGVKPNAVAETLQLLHDAGYPNAAAIGTVTETGTAPVIQMA